MLHEENRRQYVLFRDVQQPPPHSNIGVSFIMYLAIAAQQISIFVKS